MGNNLRIVEVEWVDSNGSSGWFSTKRAKEVADERPLTCRSVGYVLSEDVEDRLSLVTSLADNLEGKDMGAADIISIPMVAVLNVRDLK